MKIPELFDCSAAKFFNVDTSSHLHQEYLKAVNAINLHITETVSNFEIKLHTENHKRLIEQLLIKP